ncbi:hypothetical protein [Desulforhopalus sp. 52FAK]
MSAIEVFIFRLLIVLLLGWPLSTGVCCAAGLKHKIETKHTLLIFSAEQDVAAFNSAIDFGKGSSLSSIFGSSKTKNSDEKLARKVDLLFEKVQRILDMRKEMRPVRVRVFSDEEQLHSAFEKIFKKKCTVRGWYTHEFNTVFLNVEDVHEGMLAHELGHAIIDHFLSVRPPRATAEILAKYVDMHLHEEVKKY